VNLAVGPCAAALSVRAVARVRAPIEAAHCARVAGGISFVAALALVAAVVVVVQLGHRLGITVVVSVVKVAVATGAWLVATPPEVHTGTAREREKKGKRLSMMMVLINLLRCYGIT